MDFMSGFPKVNGLSSIIVMVDRFSTYDVFIDAPTECPSKVAAELFFKNVVKYFRMPKDVITDRDARFTGRLWTYLFNLMGMNLKFSMANHPQTDGQIERINHLLEEYSRHFMIASQCNWSYFLDSAQLSYNLHKSLAIEMSLFKIVLGKQSA